MHTQQHEGSTLTCQSSIAPGRDMQFTAAALINNPLQQMLKEGAGFLGQDGLSTLLTTVLVSPYNTPLIS